MCSAQTWSAGTLSCPSVPVMEEVTGAGLHIYTPFDTEHRIRSEAEMNVAAALESGDHSDDHETVI